MLLVINLHAFTLQMRGMIEIHAYLDDKIDAKKALEIDSKLKGMENVREMSYISKDEGLSNFEKAQGINVMDLLPVNPIPDTYRIKVRDINRIEETAERIRTIPGVADVLYGKEVVSSIISYLILLQIIFVVASAVIISATFSSINNVIRLAVYSRRREIRIMQLVGATNWFIRWPFLMEGIVIGVLGALLSVGILYLAMDALESMLASLKISLDLFMPTKTAIALVLATVTGISFIIGFTGSAVAVNNFLFSEERMMRQQRRLQRSLVTQ